MRMLKYFIPIVLLFFHTTSYAEAVKVPLPLNDLPDFTISKGQVVYQRYCFFCHGEKGEGDGQNAFSLPSRPADFNKIVPERNDEQLFAIIKQGGIKNNLSSTMPSFENTLSELQIRQLIMYLKNLVILIDAKGDNVNSGAQ
jgi:mono/diheme cytochrome c family protein